LLTGFLGGAVLWKVFFELNDESSLTFELILKVLAGR
jgi:hypothetical protein